MDDVDNDKEVFKKYPFNLDRDGYKKLVMTIPYMLIEKGMFVHVV